MTNIIKKVIKDSEYYLVKGANGSGNFGHAGRKGLVGGSSTMGSGNSSNFLENSIKAPSHIKRELKTRIVDIIEKGKGDGKEHGAIIDYKGNIKGLTMDQTVVESDSKDKIYFDDDHLDAFNNSNNELIVVHNHPNKETPFSFSHQDIMLFLQSKGIKTLIVVGHNNKMFILDKKTNSYEYNNKLFYKNSFISSYEKTEKLFNEAMKKNIKLKNDVLLYRKGVKKELQKETIDTWNNYLKQSFKNMEYSDHFDYKEGKL